MLSNLEVTTVEAIVVEELSEYGGRANLAGSGVKVTSLVQTECYDANVCGRQHRCGGRSDLVVNTSDCRAKDSTLEKFLRFSRKPLQCNKVRHGQRTAVPRSTRT